jgi:hypothetical protein
MPTTCSAHMTSIKKAMAEQTTKLPNPTNTSKNKKIMANNYIVMIICKKRKEGKKNNGDGNKTERLISYVIDVMFFW